MGRISDRLNSEAAVETVADAVDSRFGLEPPEGWHHGIPRPEDRARSG